MESGNIVIYKASDNSVFETIDVTSNQVTGSGTTQITINPGSDLAEQTSYYVQIATTAFDDSSSNSYAGISDKTSLSFTTADETNLSLSSSTPADDATAVATNSNIVLNFSEAVDVETGNIVIYKSSDDSVVETIDVTSLNEVSVTDLLFFAYSYKRLAIGKDSELECHVTIIGGGGRKSIIGW